MVAEESVIDAAIKAQGEETDEEKTERIKKGVQDTTLKLKTTAAKRYITLTWTKSKGYKVDGYQIYRSTKKRQGSRSTTRPRRRHIGMKLI